MKKILRKIAEAGKTISSGNFKASQLLIAVPLVILAAAIILSIPLLLVWGLQLLGFDEVRVGFRSWFGAILIMLFLAYASAIRVNGNKNQ
jgi:cytochrome c biogenesis factor